MSIEKIHTLIRTIPDYPKPGIQFRDITSLLKDAEGFRLCVKAFTDRYQNKKIDVVVGIEARGFILGAAIAYELGVGFVPIRKKGKLPGEVVSKDYQLEYGTDTMELHIDAISKGQVVLLVDDLLATGGTALCATSLVQELGGEVYEACFVVDLPDLKGRERLIGADIQPFFLTEFEGD